ncbi:MAG: DinB family protein [Chitinophagaceae bacterium]
MEKTTSKPGRRNFIKTATAYSTGLAGITVFPQTGWALDKIPEDGIHIIGPKEGFSPQIGTLVSMMNWMRMMVLRSVENLKKEELDYLHDPKSNTIGAMLLHLAATEMFYRANTFEGRRDYNEEEKTKWGAAMSLGENGRKTIKGNDLNYYLEILKETREKTLNDFKKRDDKWLMTVDPEFFGRKPTNNYCKWFHVCEHESNHNGQIKWIKSRLPGAKGGND